MSSMSDDPDRDRQAADEQRMRSLLAAVEAPAPPELRRSILERNAALGASSARRRWTLPMPAFALALSGVAAAACVALVLLLTTGSSSPPPTVARVALVALERPTAAAPASFVAEGTSIAFPDWTARGWPSTGARHDAVAGRRVTTEFYRSYDAGTLGYAIASGAPLGWGARGVTRRLDGDRYGVISERGATVVTWVQDGHTCILASRTAPASALLELASAQEHAVAA
jgi:hypothetical protein